MGQKLSIPSRFCVSYLRRGHYNYIIIIYCHSCAGALLANLPCIFSILVYFPLMQVHHEKKSLKVEYLYTENFKCQHRKCEAGNYDVLMPERLPTNP